MKKHFYFITLLSLLSVSVPFAANAQCPGCTVNFSCTANPAKPTICPDTLPDGIAMQVYGEDISFYLPAQFVDAGTGYNVTMNQMTVLNVTGLPYGMSWETNAVNNIYYPSSNPPATERGCARICGTPLMAGIYSVTVFVQAEVTVLGIGQTVDDNFILPLRILPASSSNSSFSITSPMGCVPHSTSFINNQPSGGNPGITYSWNFGNGNQSNLENPPLQNYSLPGTYTVSLQTNVDTIGYFLSGVSVLAATGCNDSPFSAPDYYFKLKQGSTTIYTAPYIDNTNPPVSFSYTPIPLSNLTYTLEIWEYDTGLAGGDDDCGSVTFNGHATGTQTLTSGSLITTVTIDHPVIVVNATDTVEVYPTPQVSSIVLAPNDSVCQNDTVFLHVATSGADAYQWYRDTLAVLNATDSLYYATQGGLYYCEAMNVYGCRALSNNQKIVIIENPPKPTFWITGNLLNTNLTGYSLQWYAEGDPISGANGMTCPVGLSGNYHLIATNGFGCTSTSDTVFVTFDDTGMDQLAASGTFSIFPNPTDGSFTLSVNLLAPAHLSYKLTDMAGRILLQKNAGEQSGEFSDRISMPGLAAGIYLMNVQVNEMSTQRRLVVLK